MAEGLADLANEQQCCHWHAVHDLGIFMWMDKAELAERKGMSKRLSGIIRIELPEEDFQKVKEHDLVRFLDAPHTPGGMAGNLGRQHCIKPASP